MNQRLDLKTKRGRMVIAGTVLVIAALLYLPDFNILGRDVPFRTFFCGLLLGVGVTVSVLSLTNAREIHDNES